MGEVMDVPSFRGTLFNSLRKVREKVLWAFFFPPVVSIWEKGEKKYQIGNLCVVFVIFLQVLEQLHPSLKAHDDALYYVESLCLRLLIGLCNGTKFSTIQVRLHILQSFLFVFFTQHSISIIVGCRGQGAKDFSNSH